MTVNRLHTRLIASYLAVLLVTLGVISLLLVLFLRGRPVASEPIYERLTAIVRAAEQRDGATALLLGARPERLAQLLNQLASRLSVRLLLSEADGTVLYDSLGVLEEGAQLELRLSGPPPGQQASPGAQALLYGDFRQGGEQWLFVGQRIQTRLREVLFLASAPRPQSSWAEVLNLFGNSLLVPLVEAGLVGLAIAVGLAWLVNRDIVGALGRLRGAAQAIAAGHYGERVPVQGPDELRDVARAFNHMAEQVRATQAAQQDFLANVSHDLRTPLTSIQGFSQAIIDGTSQDPAHHARIIHDEAGRLNRMVGDLLDLARIAAGRLSMRQGRVNLAPIAQGVAERLSIRAQERGVHLVQDIQAVPDMAGDGDRLAQVLTNLLDNALQFTPEGGTVRLGLRPAGGGIELSVSDTGQGIPPEDLPRVFERFYQVDKARGPRRGTGLGLAITAEIVQAHGGRIRAESGGVGRGATFRAWFPALDMSTIVRRI